MTVVESDKVQSVGTMGCLSELRLEPIAFLFMFSFCLYSTASNNLVLQKTCFPDGPPGIDAICENDDRIKESSKYNSVRGTLRECLPALTVLLAGSWLDHSGLHRPLLVLGHLGELVTLLLGLAAFYRWDLSPWLSVFGDSLPSGLAGSRAIVTMAVNAYVTEHSSPEDRTPRLARVLTAVLGGVATSSLTGGYILDYLDYSGFYFLLIGIYLFSLVLVFALVRGETRRSSGRALDSLRNFRVIFRRRPNNGILWAFIIFACLITNTLTCEGTIINLFLEKLLQMTPKEAGLFSGYRMLVSIFTAAILPPLMKKLCRLSDLTAAFISTIPSIISGVGMAFAASKAEIYIFATFDLMRIVLISTLMSLVTRSLEMTEIGTYLSFIAASEAVFPIALNPLYSYVFEHTLETLPGAFHFLSAGVFLAGSFVLLVSCCFYKQEEEKEKVDEVDLEESSVE